VQFLGTDPEVRARLAAYDALVVPSDREGCPLVAIEAFAAGVPVVGFDVPGVRDVLGSYGGGVLVPEAAGDAGLAAALVALAADARKRQACVDAGREALGRFAPEHVAAVLLQAYESACAARVGYAGGAGG
jgi:phosphatidylinositol alpha-mannosyltransferase